MGPRCLSHLPHPTAAQLHRGRCLLPFYLFILFHWLQTYLWGPALVRDAGSTEAPNTDNSLPLGNICPHHHIWSSPHIIDTSASSILAWTCHCQLQSPHSSDGCSLRPQFLPPPLPTAPTGTCASWISATVQRISAPTSSLQALAQTGSPPRQSFPSFCCHNPAFQGVGQGSTPSAPISLSQQRHL